ncbi:LDH2 family malate/lactate/ureidoglycolate dehydrogenase [Humibacillus xanthopallidus]|uniref:LDH2 family malate/lactate/ureidoglycolate dehydrogenase n=1 Tax=Humibacillus xanthopallidus TaxID=412689 RepID=A0A543PMB0_9MICO|nr:Ldh family oxidoreductase [Humibacillus xanthopallidus]TQN45215.1 LDH2 family malate/lactate/ureidoglycolate dehydrogenase [Humibacillus xanthopallidus]
MVIESVRSATAPPPPPPPPAGMVVRPDTLRALVTELLTARGVPEHDAALLADTLVMAELWGHASHGVLRLPWYAARLASGAMAAVTDVETITDSGAVLVLDGHDGIGQVVTRRAVDLGVERARHHGIAGVAVRHSGHFGTAAYFTRVAAEAGCVAILVTNASPAMAPWGGRRKSIGTNPWSIAAPAGRHGVVVMDLANTAVARGKVYLASERGGDIPQGWAADAEGNATTDPAAALAGLILPMAGPKGYVISFMMDVLAGVLTGSAFGPEVVGPYDPDRRSGAGHLLIVIDVAAMSSTTEFASRMEELVDATKSGELASWADEILVPGELEDRSRDANERDGIHLAATTWASLAALAAESGTPLPRTDAPHPPHQTQEVHP